MSLISFKDYKIDEIGEVYSGGTPKTSISEYWEGEIGWITPKDLSNYDSIFISHGERNITQKGLDNSSAKLVPKNTVLMTSRAPIGYLAIAENELSTNQGFKSLYCDEDVCYYKYFYYWLKLNIGYIINNSNGSTFKEISGSTFKNLTISLPSLENQKKISSILWNIDEKIENLKKINHNLETIAKNIFMNYFLDFEPFDNLSFTDTTIGKVPIDWRFTTISDVIDVKDGTHDSPSPVDIGFPLITSKHLNEYSVNKNEANKISFEDFANINKRSLVEPFDILISMIGTVGTISYIMCDEVDFAIKNVGLFKTSKNPLLREYLLLYLKSNVVYQYIDSHLAGSTQKYISLTELRNIPIVIPPEEVLIEFKNIINPIFKCIRHNSFELDNLMILRDTLLPKLMNGEIDVSKINL